jgi:hypothetical protein
MRIAHLLRAHPGVSLAAALALIVLLLIVFWPQPSTVPTYPGAYNLSHETPEYSQRSRACGRTGEENQYGIRITRFATFDSPDVVLQFYTAALVEHGPYTLVDREHVALIGEGLSRRISDAGERGTFEDEIPITNAQFPAYHFPQGYRVIINAAPEAEWTTVWIIEHQYEGLLRACHPW